MKVLAVKGTGVRVNRKEAETVRREIVSQGLLDGSRNVIHEGDDIIFPVLDGLKGDFDLVQKEFQDREEGHCDKAEIPNRTLEQLAYAGIGTSHSHFCGRGLVRFGTVRLCRLHWDGGYGGALLNGCRIAFEHAVRMDKEKLDRPCSS